MRELFKYPVVQAARTAASYQLLSQEALHAMGIAHVQRTLEQQQFEILFHSEALQRYPHLKAYREGERLWWVIVESSMYPQTPSRPDVRANSLHAKSEDAKVFYARSCSSTPRTRILVCPVEWTVYRSFQWIHSNRQNVGLLALHLHLW